MYAVVTNENFNHQSIKKLCAKFIVFSRCSSIEHTFLNCIFSSYLCVNYIIGRTGNTEFFQYLKKLNLKANQNIARCSGQLRYIRIRVQLILGSRVSANVWMNEDRKKSARLVKRHVHA